MDRVTKIILSLICFGLMACEEEFLPEISSEPAQIVVEGYIEAGENANPPYLIISKSVSFFSELSTDAYSGLFVHDAQVSVSDGDQEYLFTEVCLSDLSDQQKDQVASLFGLDPENFGLDFCVYLDLSFSLQGEVGKTYELEIIAEGQTLTASTSIPSHVPLESLEFRQPPGEPSVLQKV